jgi:hypothetical protein
MDDDLVAALNYKSPKINDCRFLRFFDTDFSGD